MVIYRNLALVAVIAVLAACGSADPPTTPESSERDAPERRLVIRGEMYYLERVALTPDSLAVVELRTDGRIEAPLLATTSEDLDERQVPIAFSLEVAADELPESGPYIFRGAILSRPGPLRVTDVVEITERTGEVDLGSLRMRTVPETAFGVPYRCNETTVVFGALGEHERLIVGEEVFDLRAEVSASGAHYVALDDSDTGFWSKGDEATVSVRGETLPTCERLTEPDLPFIANGQEPGWNIRIDDDGMEMLVRYGEQQLSFPRVQPEISAAGVRYVAQQDRHHLTVLIDRQVCSDTMVDLMYPFRVRYTLDGSADAGCGGDPREVLSGGEWLIEEIGGEPVAADTEPTIEFLNLEGEDRFAGRAACNRYMGGYRLSGEGLNLSPAASTLMACSDEAQTLQEQRLLGLLSEVYGFGIDAHGRLVLRAGGGTIIAGR